MSESIRQKIIEFNSIVLQYETLEFNGRDTLRLKIPSRKDLNQRLKSLGIDFEEFGENVDIVISKSNIGVKLYYNINHFLKTSNKETFEDDFAILIYDDGDSLFYSHINSKTYIGSHESNEYFVENYKYYERFVEQIESVLVFADYFDASSEEVVIFTSTKGVFKIYIPPIKPFIESHYRFKIAYDEFQAKIKIGEYRSLFKNTLIDFLKVPKDQLFLTLVLNLKTILTATDQDYELVLKKFSFKEFRSELLKQKEEYFASIRDLISKIFTQSISLPISISISAFATYEVSNPFILMLILIAFLVYSSLYVFYQWSLLKDLKEIEIDFESDFKIIEEKSGFSSELVEGEKGKVKNRISTAFATIYFMIFVIVSLTFLVVLYIVNQLVDIIWDTMIVIILKNLLS